MRDLIIFGLILFVIWYLYKQNELSGYLPASTSPKKAHNKEEWQIIRDKDGRLDKVIIHREIIFG